MKRAVVLLVFLSLALGLSPIARVIRAADPVTVHVLTMQQAALTPEEMTAIADEFMAANPNIKVEIEFVSYDALHDKFVTAMATNPPPYDVMMVDVIWYNEFIKNGYLVDVTDKITPEMKQNVLPAAWNIVTRDNKIYGMPWLLDTKYLYYNIDILKQAGFDKPPATWEELLAQAQAIKDKGLLEYPIAWSWGQLEASICDFTALLYGNGGSFLDKDGKPAFNDAKGVATLQWMVDSIDKGLTNPSSISNDEEAVRNLFSASKAAFALNWLYMYDLANFSDQESQVNGKVGITTIPVFEREAKNAKSSSVDGSSGFSVVANSPNVDAAWAYIQYLTSEPVQMKYSLHQLPIWSTSYEGDNLKQLEAIAQSSPVTVPLFKEQFSFAHVRPTVAYYLEGSKALQLALQEALTKQKSPQQALDDAAAKWLELGK